MLLPILDAPFAYEVVLQELSPLNFPWKVHVKVTDILRDLEEYAIWFIARSDKDILEFA